MFKVNRSFPAPPSLALRRSYDEEDVVKALAKDFYNKCYICETKYPHSIQIEHFVAHNNNDALKFEWANLFLSCARCNNLKRHHFNNLLNCTDPDVDILRMIKLAPPSSPGSKATIIAMATDEKTIETAKLLNKIFNEENTGNKKVAAVSLRRRVFVEFNKLMQQLNRYIDPQSINAERTDALERIRHLMRIEQEYSAFLRWAVLEDEEIYNLVEDLL